MTSIAQRRVAGATALMILLYLVQVVLFAPAGLAAVTSSAPVAGVCPEDGGWSSHQPDSSNTVSGDFGEIEFSSSETLTVTLNEGYSVEICVKQASDYEIFAVTYEEDAQEEPIVQMVWDGDLSHWGYKVTLLPPTTTTTTTVDRTTTPPSLVCIDGQIYVTVEYRAPGDLVRVDLNGDLFYSEGDERDGLTPTNPLLVTHSGPVKWEITQVDPWLKIEKGFLETIDCETSTTTTTEPTTTTTQATTTTTQATTTTTQATTTTTTQGTTITTLGTTTTLPFDSVPDEEAEVLGTTITTAPAEVLGTTITTAPAEVSADTLPFTGFESADTLKLGVLALLAGWLLLFAVRGPKEAETTGADLGGWSNL